MTTETMTTEIDEIVARINADREHGARVAAALDEMVDAVVPLAGAPDDDAFDAGMLGFVRAVRAVRTRLVAEHGESVGGSAWRDAMALHSWRNRRATGGAGEPTDAA